MDPSPSPIEQKPFRFLDLPKDLRLMVYERLVHRRHHQVEYGATELLYCGTMTIILADPIPPIYRTCRQLHAEFTSLFEDRLRTFLPRLLVNENMGNNFITARSVLGVIWHLISLVHFVHKSAAKDIRHNYGYTNVWQDTDPHLPDPSRIENYEALVRYAVRIGKYLWPDPTPDTWQYRALQIAFRTIRPGHEEWNEMVATLETCDMWEVSAVLFATEGEPTPQPLGDAGTPVQYGGVFDKKTWDRDWAETC